MPDIVNGLWIQGALSPLELLTIESFLANGFSFQLWTYETENCNAPKGTVIKNAHEIMPLDSIFTYKNTNIHGHGKGSYAGFSDIFRYKLLYEHGGIWTDMDITCLKAFTIEEDYFFRFHHKAGAVGNFMKCPKKSDVMKWCYEHALEKVSENNADWMLPITILNEGISKFNLKHSIQKISNDDSFTEILKLLNAPMAIPDEWKIIHWMNEEWRRLNISKEVCLPESPLHALYSKYNIHHKTYTGLKILQRKILLSRYFYLLQNIKSVLRWHVLPH